MLILMYCFLVFDEGERRDNAFVISSYCRFVADHNLLACWWQSLSRTSVCYLNFHFSVLTDYNYVEPDIPSVLKKGMFNTI